MPGPIVDDPSHVLDVACGTGLLTQHLQGEVTAIDQSSAMVEIAAARLPNDGTRNSVYKRVFAASALADEHGGGEIVHEGGWFVVVAA
ncbi:MAG TPA: class I SAM-dependent methyltransferase [Solirubrobacteraceae bacterium]